MNDAVASEVLRLEGMLSYETIPGILTETAQFAARTDLPQTIRIAWPELSSQSDTKEMAGCSFATTQMSG